MGAYFDVRLGSAVTFLVLLLPFTTATWKGEGEPLEYFLLEELPPNTLIGRVAVDYKLTEKFNSTVLKTLRFRIDKRQSTKQHLFAIDNVTSIVRTTTKIDRDTVCPNENVCIAWLHIAITPTGVTPDIRIMMEIVDVNDHRPVFPRKGVSISIPESAVIGTFLDLPTATDADAGRNGVQGYELVSDTDKFALELVEGDSSRDEPDTVVRLKLVSLLDREQGGMHILKVVAHDGGRPPKSASILVNVTVEDINDHDPKFDNATYEVSIRENLPPGTSVASVQARDFDLGDNAEIRYLFDTNTAKTHGHLFRIDNRTGVVYQKESLDFEKGSTYLLVVTARDKGLDSQAGQTTLIVRVDDQNDNSPKITLNSVSSGGQLELSESVRPGTFVAHLTVSDQDGGDNGKVQCTVTHDQFALQKVYQAQFRLVTTGALDRETRDEYTLTIVCQDMGNPPNTAMEDIVLRIIDSNDNLPVFKQKVYRSKLRLSDPAGGQVLQVHATDSDQGKNADIRYRLHRDASDMFKVDPHSGLISTKSVFHLDQATQIQFRVIAYDQGSPSLSSTATVLLTISDSNENVPKFSQPSYEFGVFENMPLTTEIGSVTVEDPDDFTGFPSDVHFELKNADSMTSHLFSIDPKSGRLETRVVLDRESQPVYYMSVIASRRGLLAASTGSVSVTIYVADKNDNSPIITYPTIGNNSMTISSHVPQDYHITRVRAYDNDIGGNGKLTYTITEGNEDNIFEIGPASGLVSVAGELSSRQTHKFTLTVQVQDNGYPQRRDSVSFDILVNQSIHFTSSSIGIVSASRATIVVAVTAAVLITVFLVLFGVMMLLLWKRAQPAWRKSRAEDYCYSNVQNRVTGSAAAGLAGCEAGEGPRGVAEGAGERDPPGQPDSHRTPSTSVGGKDFTSKCNVVKSGECCLNIDCDSCEKTRQHGRGAKNIPSVSSLLALNCFVKNNIHKRLSFKI